jgi:carboxylesterase
MEQVTLLKGARPFFYPGNRVGCLLIHGFTGTPFEVRWLGEHLNQQGYTVYGPRLAGHGTVPTDLARVAWREWNADVVAAYALLRSQCDRIFVAGLSMGGALAMLLASREQVDGVVAMSAPYHIVDWRKPFLPVAKLFIKTLPKGYDPQEVAAFEQHVMTEQRKRGEAPTGHPNYKAWVIPAIPELSRLLDQVQAGLPHVTAPALLIHSKADKTVPFENLQLYHDAIGSADKHMLVLEKSSHSVAEDIEYPVVFEAVSNFISARA